MTARSSIILIFIIAASILVGCAAPIAMPEPSPTPLPSETPIPTATIDWFPDTPTPTRAITQATPNPLQGLTPPAYTSVYIEDDFTDPEQWELGSSLAGNSAFGEGSLTLALNGTKGDLTSLSTHVLPAEFYLEITVDSALCTGKDTFGLIFWQGSEGGSYRLLFTCDGQMRVERRTENGSAILQDWTAARRFQPNAPARNRIGIWAQAGTVYFFVNDTYQTSIEVRKGLQGGLAVLARADEGKAATFNFSQLIITQP
jgi:hypothetical protein